MKRGIDDPKRLVAFFDCKSHRNLVLRVVDVLELRNDLQDFLIGLVAEGDAVVERLTAEQANGWRKQWLTRQYPTGYVVMPIKGIIDRIGLEATKVLQELVYAYADIRRQKGEPCRVAKCSQCRGSGRFADRRCQQCDGEGQIITFIEMSDEEKALAEGAS